MSIIADIDAFMYDSGIDVLHPGGQAKTEEMALACGVTGCASMPWASDEAARKYQPANPPGLRLSYSASARGGATGGNSSRFIALTSL